MSSGESQAPPRDLPCKELVEVITDYFEGRLSDEDRARFEHHLLGCGGCRNYVEQMRGTIRLVGTITEDDIPVDAREHLLAAFRDWKRGLRPG
jgi:anti-sigma factor RsiW